MCELSVKSMHQDGCYHDDETEPCCCVPPVGTSPLYADGQPQEL